VDTGWTREQVTCVNGTFRLPLKGEEPAGQSSHLGKVSFRVTMNAVLNT
jgi:hypothetical protein